MASPPTAVRAAASLRALVPGSLPGTTVCRRHARGRGRRITMEVVAQDPALTGTIAPECLLRNGGACRAAAGHDGRKGPAVQSSATTHKTCDESLQNPIDCPSWKGTGKAIPFARPNSTDAWRGSLPVRHRL